jgi:hypothetical protein
VDSFSLAPLFATCARAKRGEAEAPSEVGPSRLRGRTAPQPHPPDSQTAGRMFWLTRKTLSGSYAAFTRPRRAWFGP